MKLRFGFVSNSSSSSFLILTKVLPNTYQELDDILYTYLAVGEKNFDREYIYVQYLVQLLLDMRKNELFRFSRLDKDSKVDYFEEILIRKPAYFNIFNDYETVSLLSNLKETQALCDIGRLEREIKKNKNDLLIYSILYNSLKHQYSSTIDTPKHQYIDKILKAHFRLNCLQSIKFPIWDYNHMFEVSYGNEIDDTYQQILMEAFMGNTYDYRFVTKASIVCYSNDH